MSLLFSFSLIHIAEMGNNFISTQLTENVFTKNFRITTDYMANDCKLYFRHNTFLASFPFRLKKVSEKKIFTISVKISHQFAVKK